MTIEDFRVGRCKKHKLVDILMVVFFGLLRGHKSVEEIHFYLELSNLKGVIVTIDAMVCQKKTAEKATKKRANHLFSLKGNRGTVLAIARALFARHPQQRLRDKREECLEKAHDYF